MVKALCIAAVLLAAGGCKDITKDAEAIRDRACACADKTCSDAVLDDLVTLTHTSTHSSNNDETKLRELGAAIGTCLIKAGTDPNDLLTKLDAK